jgi:hypothetical protein
MVIYKKETMVILATPVGFKKDSIVEWWGMKIESRKKRTTPEGESMQSGLTQLQMYASSLLVNSATESLLSNDRISFSIKLSELI